MRALGIVGFMLLVGTQGAEAACSGSGQSWSCAAGTTVAQINATLGAAANDAILTFEAGNYSWAATIDLPNARGVTMRCATRGNCNVTVGGTFLGMALSGNHTNFYRVTGFRFLDAPAVLAIWVFGPGVLRNIRIDNNIFQNFNADSIAIFFGEIRAAGTYYGVIDHNTFTGPNNFLALKVLGHGDPDAWGPSPKGTANNMFFEDNVISFGTAANLGAGCMDMWNSAALVYRNNRSTNCLVTAHGVVHGGVINFEVYRNTLIRTANSGGWENGTRLFHHQGSGEFLAFDNVFTAAPGAGESGSALAMTHYRSATPSAGGYGEDLGRCDGTRPIDGNRAPTTTYFGYPCWRQPGRDGAQGLQPMYAWNNRWSGTGRSVDLAVENPWSASNPSVETHLQANRDYYNAVSTDAQTSPTNPFDGSTGMGHGTLANRPSSCATNTTESGGGVGYFATDQGPQGTLYRCTSANTWVVQYSPFTYPHPLVSGGTNPGAAPSAPTNVRVLP